MDRLGLEQTSVGSGGVDWGDPWCTTNVHALPSELREGTHLFSPEFHVARELRQERLRESVQAYDQRLLLEQAKQDRPARRSFVRRPVALLLAALSRWTLQLVRRLDECVAEDLAHRIAATE